MDRIGFGAKYKTIFFYYYLKHFGNNERYIGGLFGLG
jgi:hypothetical protein